ncbi:MAG: TldD/PmbA family protein [Thermoplasmata archaeon]
MLGKELELDYALGLLEKAGVEYGDVRFVMRKAERISTKNGVPAISISESLGVGIRVLFNGAWGFASTNEISKRGIKRVVELAVRTAKASAMTTKEKAVLCPVEPAVDRYESVVKKDPWEIPTEERVNYLIECEKRMRVSDRIKLTMGHSEVWEETKLFGSTEGARISQRFVETGGGISAMAVETGEMQTRSYPTSFGGDYRQGGHEFFEGLKLLENAERVGKEAEQLLHAAQCPSEVTTIIISSDQMVLQVHESCGHPSELDRVFGYEASYAGTSFMTPEKLNKFRYGSDLVNIVGDATAPGGLGTFGYDDEGVKAQCFHIIKNGIISGYLSSRETAAKLGQRSTGAMRADNYNRMPIIRMTNINLLPGNWKFEELIKDTKKGIYVETNKSWSIDDRRLNFQFGTEIGYRIENGEMKEMLKNCVYTGITYEFWRSCDAICSEEYWHLWGLRNCGKGEPGQVMRVGHGTSPTRFNNVRVGVGKW